MIFTIHFGGKIPLFFLKHPNNGGFQLPTSLPQLVSLDPRIFWERHQHQGPIKKWPSRSIRPPGSKGSRTNRPKVRKEPTDFYGRKNTLPETNSQPLGIKLGHFESRESHGYSHRNVSNKKNNGRHQRILTKEKMWGSKNSAGAKGWKGWIFFWEI